MVGSHGVRRVLMVVGAGAWVGYAVVGATGCATGFEPEGTSQAYDGNLDAADDDDGPTAGGMGTFDGPIDTSADGPVTSSADSADSADGPGVPDLGMCGDDADCTLPPGTCLQEQGMCVGGLCMHDAAAPGAVCDDGDACTTGDACDGEGVCFGVALDCGAGSCVAGECMGGGCPPGFAECNGNAGDGCETELGTTSNCGGCGDSCGAGAHANASCSAGACQFSCEAPWEDCDGDMGNGCEVPVGVEHQCSASGLDANGCWTAYCGASANPDASNFGTYYCMDCATCSVPGAGQCQWCNHSNGLFYPADACACGTYENLAC